MPDVLDLEEMCRTVIFAAKVGESVEAYASESRRTEVNARSGAVESLSFAETRGVGVRVIVDGRLGYAYAADPDERELLTTLERARDNGAQATPDPANALPDKQRAEPLLGLFRQPLAALHTTSKVDLTLALDRAAVRLDPRVRKVEQSVYGDAVSRIGLASTADDFQEYSRTDCWCAVSALAEGEGETQTGHSFRLARQADELDWEACAGEAVTRAARLLGARKPPTARLPVVLDRPAAVAFLGVLAGALSAEAVQKGRSLFAQLEGEAVGSQAVTLLDDGRLLAGPAAAPFDDEGVPTQRTPLIERGKLAGFLHNTYTARRGGVLSTGNAGRAGYRTPPGVAPSNFFLEPGTEDPEALLASAEGGVFVQEVSGVHSGANPISGEFSVGATGLRISGEALGEPLREMTVASTLPEALKAIREVGRDLRFFGSIGAPTVLVGEMTVAGA